MLVQNDKSTKTTINTLPQLSPHVIYLNEFNSHALNNDNLHARTQTVNDAINLLIFMLAALRFPIFFIK